MAYYFFDTSALIKRYHREPGHATMMALFTLPQAQYLISELTVVELHSAIAKKVRMKELHKWDSKRILIRFSDDVISGLLAIVPLSSVHMQEAICLINCYGFTHSLRTLDALQLAVAVELRERGRLECFVTADENLEKIAKLEGIAVINPEKEEEQ
jgi:predicted nucleic acid-binding protein